MGCSNYSNSQLDNGILEDLELGVDGVHQVRDLRLRIQHLNTLGVGIVPDTERTGNRVGKFTKKKIFNI